MINTLQRVFDSSFGASRAILFVLVAGGLVACDGDDGNNGLNSLIDIRYVSVGDPALPIAGNVVTVTSGDNTLASPALTAGFENHDAGNQVYDAIALDYIEFDAMAIGNHDFDFGPDRLADFIEDHVNTQVPFLSANLDFSNETDDLQALVASGRIAASVVVESAGEHGARMQQLLEYGAFQFVE